MLTGVKPYGSAHSHVYTRWQDAMKERGEAEDEREKEEQSKDRER